MQVNDNSTFFTVIYKVSFNYLQYIIFNLFTVDNVENEKIVEINGDNSRKETENETSQSNNELLSVTEEQNLNSTIDEQPITINEEESPEIDNKNCDIEPETEQLMVKIFSHEFYYLQSNQILKTIELLFQETEQVPAEKLEKTPIHNNKNGEIDPKTEQLMV